MSYSILNRVRGALAGLMLVALSLSLSQGVPAASAATPNASYSYTFEGKLDPWKAGLHSLLDLTPDVNACPNLGTSAALLTAGPTAGRDGAPAKGLVASWMQAPMKAFGDSSVSLDFSVLGRMGCGKNCAPAVYIGTKVADASSVFDTNFAAFNNGSWQSYHYTTGVTAKGYVYVGLGWTNLQTPLGGQIQQVALDCVTVTITSNTR